MWKKMDAGAFNDDDMRLATMSVLGVLFGSYVMYTAVWSMALPQWFPSIFMPLTFSIMRAYISSAVILLCVTALVAIFTCNYNTSLVILPLGLMFLCIYELISYMHSFVDYMSVFKALIVPLHAPYAFISIASLIVSIILFCSGVIWLCAGLLHFCVNGYWRHLICVAIGGLTGFGMIKAVELGFHCALDVQWVVSISLLTGLLTWGAASLGLYHRSTGIFISKKLGLSRPFEQPPSGEKMNDLADVGYRIREIHEAGYDLFDGLDELDNQELARRQQLIAQIPAHEFHTYCNDEKIKLVHSYIKTQLRASSTVIDALSDDVIDQIVMSMEPIEQCKLFAHMTKWSQYSMGAIASGNDVRTSDVSTAASSGLTR